MNIEIVLFAITGSMFGAIITSFIFSQKSKLRTSKSLRKCTDEQLYCCLDANENTDLLVLAEISAEILRRIIREKDCSKYRIDLYKEIKTAQELVRKANEMVSNAKSEMDVKPLYKDSDKDLVQYREDIMNRDV